MLEELVRFRLEVRKVRTERGYIRIAISSNAEWYRLFCRKYMNGRRNRRMKIRTIIRRIDTVIHLTKLVQHGPIPGDKSIYRARLLEAIEEYSVEICRQYGVQVA